MYKTFETERLILRPTDLTDTGYIFEIMNSSKWLRFIGDRNIRTPKDAEDYITGRIQPQFEKLGFGSYTMIRKTDSLRVGSCGLYDREGLNGIDIGFALLPEFEGKGYASEGSLRIRDAAFREFDLKTIYAVTVVDNHSSQRLLDKLGLKFFQMTRLPGDDEEIMLYRMTKDEYNRMMTI